MSYLFLIDDTIFWESREEYIQILELFVSKKITLDQFLSQFYRLRGLNLRSSKMLKNKLEEQAFVVSPKSTEINLQVNFKSEGFTKIISFLYSLTDLYDPDVTLEMNFDEPELRLYGISEEYLRLMIESNFLTIFYS